MKETLLILALLAVAGSIAHAAPRDLNADSARIRIAAVSCCLRAGDPKTNLKQIAKWTRLAARSGADIVLFNETSATGYWMNSDIRRLAEPLDGPIVKELTKLAARNKIVICAGLMEAADSKQYNTQVLVGSKGLLGSHRKSSLPGGEEKFFDVGNDYNVFNVHGRKIGIAICFESINPETCHKLAANGAQVILAPYHNGVTAIDIHDGKRPYFSERAKQNHVWYIACDECSGSGKSMTPGAVCFVNPSGEIVAVTPTTETREHMIMRELDLEPVCP